MAEINENESGRQRSLKRRPLQIKRQVRVDMTPMVDLGFLLITFFMLTMVLSESRSMVYNKPLEGAPIDVSDCQVLSLLIDSNQNVFAYRGLNFQKIEVKSLNRNNGLRQLIMQSATEVKNTCGTYASGKQRELICLIKLLPGSKYKSMIDVLDEMEITQTKTYAIQEATMEELAEVSAQQKKLLANN